MWQKLTSWWGARRRAGTVAQSEVIRLAWPIASAMLGEAIMGLVDTKLVSGLGATALGGVGVASSLFHLSYITVLGLMRGVKVCTSHAVGGGHPNHGVRYAVAGVSLGLLTGILFGLLFQHTDGFLRGLHINGDLVSPAAAFLSARSWGLPAACALAALIEHRQGIGDVRTPMLVGLAGNILNAGLAYALIYGRFGLPALGVRGAGYGTAITEVVQLSVMLILLLGTVRKTRRLEGIAAATLPWRAAARDLLSVGVPTALHFGCECAVFPMFTAILGSLSDADVAAHQIAGAINRMAYIFGAAIGEAACVLVGRALGAQRLDEADQAVGAATRVAGMTMAICGLAFAVCGNFLAHAFTDDDEVARLITRLLWIAAVWQILDAINIIMRAALRGAKDVRAAAVMGITILWTTVPTTVWFLGKVAGWGVVGGWFGFVLATGLSAVLFSRRWAHGAWRHQFMPAHAAPTPAPALMDAAGIG